MKKILIGLLLMITSTVIAYLGFSFVALTIDFKEWHELTRGFYVFVWALCCLGSVAIANIDYLE